jgi:DNA processing protein
VFVIPHKIGESKGTNFLAQTLQVEVIWDIEEFAYSLGIDEKNNQILDVNEAMRIYGDKIYEMELNGEIRIENGMVYF